MRQYRNVSSLCLALLVAVAAGPAGCEESSPPRSTRPPERLVVMSPAITQMILDLGAGEKIVGVGNADPFRERLDAEVVGDFNSFHKEKLIALDPTDIFVQSNEPIDPALLDLATKNGWRVHRYMIENIADVQRVLVHVGSRLQLPDKAARLATDFQLKLAEISAEMALHPRKRTLILAGQGNLTAAGPTTFLHEMLRFAGGSNVIEESGILYPVLDKERIVELNPEVIIILHGDGGSVPEAPPPAIASLEIPAVTEDRVRWLADEHAMLPTTTIPRITAKMAKLLHPGEAASIDRIMAQDSAPEPEHDVPR